MADADDAAARLEAAKQWAASDSHWQARVLLAALQAAETDASARTACATCDALGFQAGAHTDRVEECPTCDGALVLSAADAEAVRKALRATLAHAEELRMDTDDDERVRLSLVVVLRAALALLDGRKAND